MSIRKREAAPWVIAIALLSVLLVLVSTRYFSQNRMIEYEVADELPIMIDSSGNPYIEAGFRNVGSNDFNAEGQYYIAYHIYAENGKIIDYDGRRSEITLGPGETKFFKVYLDPKHLTGPRTILGLDLIKEGAYWFSDRNNIVKKVVAIQ